MVFNYDIRLRGASTCLECIARHRASFQAPVSPAMLLPWGGIELLCTSTAYAILYNVVNHHLDAQPLIQIHSAHEKGIQRQASSDGVLHGAGTPQNTGRDLEANWGTARGTAPPCG